MNYAEIIKLLDAGYTREEILNMKAEPEEQKEPEEPKESENASGVDSVLAEMKDMFSEMKKEITALNIMQSRQPAEEKKTTEEIIANIINPTKGGK